MTRRRGAPSAGSPPPAAGAAAGPARPVRVVAVLAAGVALVALLAVADLTLGTSRVGAGDLLRLLAGTGDEEALAVLVASRAPRVLAGLLVGVALGLSGCALQSVARNPLASPDTLAGGRVTARTISDPKD